jgi:hypothetical protein
MSNPEMVRAKLLYERTYEARMRLLEDMTVSAALATGEAFVCPGCRLVHPGLYYSTADHRPFCSRKCFQKCKRRHQ